MTGRWAGRQPANHPYYKLHCACSSEAEKGIKVSPKGNSSTDMFIKHRAESMSRVNDGKYFDKLLFQKFGFRGVKSLAVIQEEICCVFNIITNYKLYATN